MIGKRNSIFSAILALCMLLPACYHLRVNPEPIEPKTLIVHWGSQECIRTARNILQNSLNLRVLEEDKAHLLFVTSPHHFATETGFGQPPGGRKYLMQLKISALQKDDTTVLTVAPHNLEIRTTYAYNQSGQVATLYKHYPYEEYPGMFDTELITRELTTVTELIRKGLPPL